MYVSNSVFIAQEGEAIDFFMLKTVAKLFTALQLTSCAPVLYVLFNADSIL